MPEYLNSKRSISYQDLLVWQKGIQLAKEVYAVTKYFPLDERFGLISQIKRAAISIPSNIAEGQCRGTKKDFTQFLRIAYGSAAELKTEIILAKELSFIKDSDYEQIISKITEIEKMLNALIQSLSSH